VESDCHAETERVGQRREKIKKGKGVEKISMKGNGEKTV